MDKKKKSIVKIPVKVENKSVKPVVKASDDKPKRGRPRKESEETAPLSIIATPVNQIDDKPRRGRPKKAEEDKPIAAPPPEIKIEAEDKPLTKSVKKVENKTKGSSKREIAAKQDTREISKPPVF